MVRATLLKAKSSMPSLNGDRLGHNGSIKTRMVMRIWIIRVAALTCSLLKRIKEMSLQPKGSKLTNHATMGWPKGGNSYGHGASIVPATISTSPYGTDNTVRRGRLAVKTGLNLRYYSTGCTNNVVSRLNCLTERCRNYPDSTIDRPLHKLVSDPLLLEIAYRNIKSKPGNMTPGITPETLDGISSEFLNQLGKSLRDESFQFKPGRRVQIPKASGGTCPLTVAPPRDKIVQETMRMILNAIYEPTFHDSSHGFRPGRSCHTALRDIFLKFKPTTWMIEGDISKCFDSIDHHKLMRLIENKILDRQFTNLIWKSLRAGYFEFRYYKHDIVGTPQGSIISPILCNIFMHQLDLYVESLAREFNKGTRA